MLEGRGLTGLPGAALDGLAALLDVFAEAGDRVAGAEEEGGAEGEKGEKDGGLRHG